MHAIQEFCASTRKADDHQAESEENQKDDQRHPAYGERQERQAEVYETALRAQIHSRSRPNPHPRRDDKQQAHPPYAAWTPKTISFDGYPARR